MTTRPIDHLYSDIVSANLSVDETFELMDMVHAQLNRKRAALNKPALNDKVQILSGKYVGEIGTVHWIPQLFFDYLIKLPSGAVRKYAREDFEIVAKEESNKELK